jgi:ribose transport system permease protein
MSSNKNQQDGMPNEMTANHVPFLRGARISFERFYRSSEAGTLAAVILLMILLTAANGQFLTRDNLIFTSRSFSFIAVAAMGACFVIISGGIDLSVGSVMGLAGVIAAFLSTHGYGTTIPVVGALLVGVVIGLINGMLVAKVGLAPFIVTLGTLSIFRSFIYIVTGGFPMQGFTPSLLFIGQGFLLGIPMPVWIMIAFWILLTFVLGNMRLGWYTYSIGGNEEAARLSGLPVDRVKILVYVIAGLMGAIGGLLLVARLGVGESTAGLGYELNVIAAAVIGGVSLKGGQGSAFSAVLGAALIGVLNNGLVLLGVGEYLQQMVIGAVIILAVSIDRVRARSRN